MSTFDEDEGSVEDSEPREGYQIDLPLTTWRISSSDQDEVIGGFTYRAQPIDRDELPVSDGQESKELSIQMLVSHPVAARYLAGGVPPKRVFVTCWRQQRRSGVAEKQWSGFATSIAPIGRVANLRIASRLGEALLRRMPTLTAGRLCGVTLFDEQCTVSRATFGIAAVVVGITGRVVTLAALGGKPDDWALDGDLVYPSGNPNGERMTIRDQTGTVITMQMPIRELAIGHTVDVFPGCSKEIATCRDKFANQVNFRGVPELPTANPHIPNGFGVYTS